MYHVWSHTAPSLPGASATRDCTRAFVPRVAPQYTLPCATRGCMPHAPPPCLRFVPRVAHYAPQVNHTRQRPICSMPFGRRPAFALRLTGGTLPTLAAATRLGTGASTFPCKVNSHERSGRVGRQLRHTRRTEGVVGCQLLRQLVSRKRQPRVLQGRQLGTLASLALLRHRRSQQGPLSHKCLAGWPVPHVAFPPHAPPPAWHTCHAWHARRTRRPPALRTCHAWHARRTLRPLA